MGHHSVFFWDESDETKEICHTNNYPLFADAKESLSEIKIREDKN